LLRYSIPNTIIRDASILSSILRFAVRQGESIWTSREFETLAIIPLDDGLITCQQLLKDRRANPTTVYLCMRASLPRCSSKAGLRSDVAAGHADTLS